MGIVWYFLIDYKHFTLLLGLTGQISALRALIFQHQYYTDDAPYQEHPIQIIPISALVINMKTIIWSVFKSPARNFFGAQAKSSF